VLALRWR